MTIKKSCKAYIQSTATILKNYKNTSIDLSGITTGAASNIPVVLAANKIKFPLSSLIKLPEEASNISCIRNKVVLIDCKFLQDSKVLFIRGFVRKNIYYSLNNSHNNSRYCLIYLPFVCTASVNLNGLSSLSKVNDNFKFKYYKKNKLPSVIPSDFNKVSEEFFNSKPFCELTSIKIIEQCKYIYKKDNNHSSNPLDIKKITKLKDNMVVNLEISILQNLEVYIKPCCICEKSSISGCNNISSKEKFTLESKPDLSNKCEYDDKDIYDTGLYDLLNVLVSLHNSNSQRGRNRSRLSINRRFQVPWLKL